MPEISAGHELEWDEEEHVYYCSECDRSFYSPDDHEAHLAMQEPAALPEKTE